MNTLRKMLLGSLAVVAVFSLLLSAGPRASARATFKPNLVVSFAGTGNGPGGANDWRIHVTVKNTSAIASTNGDSVVQFRKNLGQVATAVVPTLGPGQSATVLIQVSSCENHGTVTADVLNEIAESNELDNRFVVDDFC